MSYFDFIDSSAPAAEPLARSHSASQIESELKGVFLDLFAKLGEQSFDANVLGAAHLGSFDLVRRMVNHDGLILLPGEREEAATRYLYRAWKSGDIQKRGLHFVRTYLQLLFPGQAEVRQLWHAKDHPYGTAFVLNEPRDAYWYHFLGEPELALDGSWRVGRPLALDGIVPPPHAPDESDLFLTSRIEVLLGLESIAEGALPLNGASSPATTGLIEVLRSVVPARLVPVFRFWLRFVLALQVRADYRMLMEKHSPMRYPWCGKVISDQPDALWQLGRDGKPVALKSGLALGAFKLGEVRGHISHWRLKSCRIASAATLQSTATTLFHPQPKLGQADRRLNGRWALSRPQLDALSNAKLIKSVVTTQTVSVVTTFHEHYTLRVPCQPQRLGRPWRLGGGARLNAGWQLGGAAGASPLGAFRLRQAGIDTTTVAALRIDGTCRSGAVIRLPRTDIDDGRLQTRKKAQSDALAGLTLGADEHLAHCFAELASATQLPLDGRWRLGQAAAPEGSLTITRV